MEYNFRFGSFSGIFALPAEAADTYLNEATHADLKVLLYVFKRGGAPVNEAQACAFLGIQPEQLKASLDYWAGKKLFSFSALSEPEQSKADTACEKRQDEAQSTAKAQAAAHRVLDVPAQYGQEEIAKKTHDNAEVKFLFGEAQMQFGRPISPAECSILLYLYEGAGLPADVIAMAIGYCVSSGKSNIRYIQKLALGWADEGIDSHERAEAKIRELETRRGFEGQIRTIMGITDRAFTPTERQHIRRWCDWNMSAELIKLAYDIAVTRTGRLSLSYINSIVSSWHEKGFTTVEQARGESKRGSGTASNSKSPSYDIDEYVRLSMNRLHNE